MTSFKMVSTKFTNLILTCSTPPLVNSPRATTSIQFESTQFMSTNEPIYTESPARRVCVLDTNGF